MKRGKSFWLRLSLLASFLAVGIPYWLVPYNTIKLPYALLHPGLFVAAAAALLLCMYRLASFWRSTGMVTLSVGASVFARVLVDGMRDPNSHNLWPFEVVIALVVGFACALPGAIVGSLIARWVINRSGDAQS